MLVGPSPGKLNMAWRKIQQGFVGQIERRNSCQPMLSAACRQRVSKLRRVGSQSSVSVSISVAMAIAFYQGEATSAGKSFSAPRKILLSFSVLPASFRQNKLGTADETSAARCRRRTFTLRKFIIPMRDHKIVEALHEPARSAAWQSAVSPTGSVIQTTADPTAKRERSSKPA
jgi:hypothetical protein